MYIFLDQWKYDVWLLKVVHQSKSNDNQSKDYEILEATLSFIIVNRNRNKNIIYCIISEQDTIYC